MAIFSTKDFSAAKSDKVRVAVGRRLGKIGGAQASNAEVDNECTEFLKRLVQADDANMYQLAMPAPDPL